MKKLYYLFLLAFVPMLSQAQTLNVTLNNSTVCKGQAVTATVKVLDSLAGPPSSGFNSQNGVMFEIYAAKTVVIKGFTAEVLSNGSDFEVYSRTGSFVGNENSSTGWTLLDSSKNIPSGKNINIGVNLSRAILAGQTVSFYVTSTSNSIRYVNGTSVGDTLASNNDLLLKEGIGKAYPFGNTYTPRNFVGSILYEPVLSDIRWNISSDTTDIITFNPSRSTVVEVTANANGQPLSAYTVLDVSDVSVAVTATPDTIQSGQSSTLSSTVTTVKGLSTTFESGNGNQGAMLDIEANKNGMITGFTVSSRESNTSANMEIFYKTGTHVGSESSAAAWTSLDTYSNVASGKNIYLPLSTPLAISANQTLAFYITVTNSAFSLRYTNGTAVGNTSSSDANLKILEGTGIGYPFGNANTPRVLNTIVHYKIENPNGTSYSWSPGGGSSGSKNVTPTTTTTYSLTTNVYNCTDSNSVTVYVDGTTGLNELVLQDLKIYPNPAKDFINLNWADASGDASIILTDLHGRLVYGNTLKKSSERLRIPVSNLAKGMYFLKIQMNDKASTYKVQVL